jgi:elongator complex protein 4
LLCVETTISVDLALVLCNSRSLDDYCRVFDLTSRVPASAVDRALSSKQLTIVDVPISESFKGTMQVVLEQVKELLTTSKESKGEIPIPMRICIPALGSPAWGDMEPQVNTL